MNQLTFHLQSNYLFEGVSLTPYELHHTYIIEIFERCREYLMSLSYENESYLDNALCVIVAKVFDQQEYVVYRSPFFNKFFNVQLCTFVLQSNHLKRTSNHRCPIICADPRECSQTNYLVGYGLRIYNSQLCKVQLFYECLVNKLSLNFCYLSYLTQYTAELTSLTMAQK